MAQPTATYEAVIAVPVSSVWGLLQDFGTWSVWWPFYKSTTITSNTKQGVGAIRHAVTANGDIYEEEITQADPTAYVLEYNSNSADGKVTTKVNIQLWDVKDMQTKMSWNSWTEGRELLPEVLVQLGADQRAVYSTGAKAVVMKLVGTFLLGIGTGFIEGNLKTFNTSMLFGEQEKWQYADYAKEFQPMPRMAMGLPPSEAMQPPKLSKLFNRFLDVAYLQIDDLLTELSTGQEASATYNPKDATASLVEFAFGRNEETKYFTTRLTEKWKEDEEFCQQMLTGTNPMHIRMVTPDTDIPEPLLPLKAPTGESIPELIQQHRLFILDHRDLDNGKRYAPVTLVYRELLEDNKSRLNMVGIVLDGNKKEAAVYTPDMEHKNRYLLAKMIVANSDNEIHQTKYHLCLAHFAMEAMIVAVHNAFPKEHPIRALLTPHFYETLGINFISRPLDDKGQVDVERMKLISKQWAEYDFFSVNFEEQLRARGFDEERTDKVEGYHFRDDGFLIWNAIGDYVSDIVDHFYKSSDDVANDKFIQGWAHEMSAKERAAIKGFPERIFSKELLIKILQTIIWNGTGMHSALHYSQWPYLGYAPNKRTRFGCQMPPEDGKDIEESYIIKGMGPQVSQLAQMLIFWTFTGQSENHLSNLASMKEHYPEADKRIEYRLREIAGQINERNRQLEAEGKAPYLYLLPDNVASSINV